MDRAQGNGARPSPDVPTDMPETDRGAAGKRCVLSFAGLDNTAGAGLLADIKTFELFDLYGLGVPTAITVQTPDSVLEVSCCSAGRMRRSLETMLGSCKVLGIKTGLLCDEAAIDVLSSALRSRFEGILIVDPVLHSSDGKQLITPRGRLAMSENLFLMADVITPNIDEAGLLARRTIKSRADVHDCAKRLCQMGPKSVVITGSGRFGGEDFFFDGSEGYFIPGQTGLASSVEKVSVHGTGCFYSASLLSLLVLGKGLREAATKAKFLTEKAILTSLELEGQRSRLIDHSAVRQFILECV
ncbi:MAG TPA: hydroxymethylpyrimidine/phosphomethylpyrimidine kinase [bacterium]|nr:hydroxymethylpyrimidine/phosphomethylpyrimidine kinase [bacterium]